MDTNEKEGRVVLLRIDDIIPNRFQPREIFDESALTELSDSIKEHGVIQPIIVRPIGNKYELIAGERRTKAASLAGLTTIPAIVREMSDNESAKISLLENLQRRNLSAIEEARTYKRILELDNMTQEQLAKTMGCSQPMIANKLRLLALPEEIQDALMKNQISERHARSLLNVKDKEQQLKLLDRIRDERLTVRELDAEIKKLKAGEAIVEAEITDKDTLTKDIKNDIEREVDKDMNNGMMNGNFGGNPNNFGNNYRSNFGNMGLNDYQSSINNGMFNNIPNLNNQMNPSIPEPTTTFDNNYSSTSLANENFGMNSNQMPQNNNFNPNNNNFSSSMPIPNEPMFNGPINEPMPNNSFANNPFEETKNQGNNYNSLGSMFDNNSNMGRPIEPSNNSDSNSSKHLISQIKDDLDAPKENQFLPNFVNNGPGNFSNQNEFSNENNFNQSMNNDFNNFNNATNNFGNNNFNDNSINDFSNNPNNVNNFNLESFASNMGDQYSPTNVFNNFSANKQNNNNFNEPINDLSNAEQNNFQYYNHVDSRQGGLFNEPLNLVDVPNNNSDMNVSETTSENNSETNFDFKSNVSNQSSPQEFDYNSYNENTNSSNYDSSTTNDDSDRSSDDNWTKFDDVKETQGEQEEQAVPQEEKAPMEDVEVIDSSNDNRSNNSNPTGNDTKKDYIQLDPVRTIFDTREAVYELKKTTDRIKENKINIDTEEIEFDDYYQIVIKIKK